MLWAEPIMCVCAFLFSFVVFVDRFYSRLLGYLCFVDYLCVLLYWILVSCCFAIGHLVPNVILVIGMSE